MDGDELTVTGSGFEDVQGSSTAVLAGTSIPVVAWSATSVTATVPSGHESGYAGVVVDGTTSNGIFVEVVDADDPSAGPPAVTQLSPTSGPAGTIVTFTGSGFGTAMGCDDTVVFAGVATPREHVQSWSEDEVVVEVPPGSVSGYAGVVVNGVVSNGIHYQAGTPPTVDSVTPSPVAPGTDVTISGAGFGDDVGSSYPVLRGAPLDVVSWSSTRVVATVPAGAASGYAGIVRDGTTSNGVFVHVTGTASPTLDAIDVDSGPVGTEVTFSGSQFGDGSGPDDHVVFNGQRVEATDLVSWTDTEVVATVPVGASDGYAGIVRDGQVSNGKYFDVTAATREQVAQVAPPPVAPEGPQPTGSEVAVTTRILDDRGRPLEGLDVVFEVHRRDVARDGDPPAIVARVPSGPDGRATFTYVGPTSAATDSVVACIDMDDDGCSTSAGGEVTLDPDDRSSTRSDIEFQTPIATAIAIVATGTATVEEPHAVSATVRDQFGSAIGDGTEVVAQVFRDTPDTDPVLVDTVPLTTVGGGVAFEHVSDDPASVDDVLVCIDQQADGCAVIDNGNVVPDARDPADAVVVVWQGYIGLRGLDRVEVGESSALVGDANLVDQDIDKVRVDRFRRGAGGDHTLVQSWQPWLDSQHEFAVSLGTRSEPTTDLLVACVDHDEDGCATVVDGVVVDDPDDVVRRRADRHWLPEGTPGALTIAGGFGDESAGDTVSRGFRLLDLGRDDPVPGVEITLERRRYTDEVATPVTTTHVTDANGEFQVQIVGPGVRADDGLLACLDTDDDGCGTTEVDANDPHEVRVRHDPDDHVFGSSLVRWFVDGHPSYFDVQPFHRSVLTGTDVTLTVTGLDHDGSPTPGTFDVTTTRHVGSGEPTTTTTQITLDAAGEGTIELTGPPSRTRDVVEVCHDVANDGCDREGPSPYGGRDGHGGASVEWWEAGQTAELHLDPRWADAPITSSHTVQVTALDAEATPVDGADITVEVARAFDDDPAIVSVTQATTGGDGTVDVELSAPVDPETHRITVCAPSSPSGCPHDAEVRSQGQVEWYDPDSVGHGGIEIDVAQDETGATVSLLVSERDGDPVDGAALRIDVFRDDGSGWAPTPDGDVVTTDAAGTAGHVYSRPSGRVDDVVVVCLDRGEPCRVSAGSSVQPIDTPAASADLRWFDDDDTTDIALDAPELAASNTTHDVVATATQFDGDPATGNLWFTRTQFDRDGRAVADDRFVVPLVDGQATLTVEPVDEWGRQFIAACPELVNDRCDWHDGITRVALVRIRRPGEPDVIRVDVPHETLTPTTTRTFTATVEDAFGATLAATDLFLKLFRAPDGTHFDESPAVTDSGTTDGSGSLTFSYTHDDDATDAGYVCLHADECGSVFEGSRPTYEFGDVVADVGTQWSSSRAARTVPVTIAVR